MASTFSTRPMYSYSARWAEEASAAAQRAAPWDTNNSRRLSQTACAQCRTHKIRCSRLLPTCTRCQRRSLQCQYPEPPDRRLLWSQRVNRLEKEQRSIQNKERSFQRDDVLSTGPSDRTSLSIIESSIPELVDMPVTADANFSNPVDRTTTSVPVYSNHPPTNPPLLDWNSPSQTLRSLLPEKEVGTFLIELYCNRAFSGHLLIDHQKFLDDYRADRATLHLLFAVFSCATLFLSPSSGSKLTKTGDLGTFLPLRNQARTWAEAGSRLVLSRADKPTPDTVRTLELLGFFWWATGDLERVAIHFAISYESIRILQRRLDRSPHINRRARRALRRLQWACWIKMCLIDSTEAGADVAESCAVPTLDDDDDADSDSGRGLSDTHIDDWFTWDEHGRQNCGRYCVQLLFMWREIRNLVRQSWKQHSSTYVQDVIELDRQLQRLWRSVPDALRSEHVMRGSVPRRVQWNAMFLKSMHYLCIIYLYASLIPGLSGSHLKLDLPTHLAEFCAQTAVVNATEFADMARKFFATRPDFSRIPPFVAYCAFIAGSVHGVLLGLEGLSARERVSTWKNGVLCLMVLQESKVFFPSLHVLWQELKDRLDASRESMFGQTLSMSDSTFYRLVHDPDSIGAPAMSSSMMTKTTALSRSSVDTARGISVRLSQTQALFESTGDHQDPFILRYYIPPAKPESLVSDEGDEEDDGEECSPSSSSHPSTTSANACHTISTSSDGPNANRSPPPEHENYLPAASNGGGVGGGIAAALMLPDQGSGSGSDSASTFAFDVERCDFNADGFATASGLELPFAMLSQDMTGLAGLDYGFLDGADGNNDTHVADLWWTTDHHLS